MRPGPGDDPVLLGFAGVRVPVADVAATREWQHSVDLGRSVTGLLELQPEPRPAAPRPDEVGALHICLRTSDIDAAHRHLSDAGARFATRPQASHAGPSVAFFRDPAGVQFQLIELAGGPLAGDDPPPVAEAIGTLHHFGMTVPDLDDAVGWYESVLGSATVVRSSAAGEAAARLLGLEAAVYDAAVLTVGGHWLELMAFERPPAPPAVAVGGSHVRFVVEDLAPVRRRLAERGGSGEDRGGLLWTTGPGGFQLTIEAEEKAT